MGTVHEIALARQQHKPVLFVSPRTPIPALQKLEDHLDSHSDEEGKRILKELLLQQPIRPNTNGAPSIWYMGILDGDYFFDGFGFDHYRRRYPAWRWSQLDELERRSPPERPLLRYLDKVDIEIPKRYDHRLRRYVVNDDWLIFERKANKTS